MLHLPDLIRDLTVILIAAGVVTLVFKKIRQPVVLGYILVGLLVNSHVPFIPAVADNNGIKVWAEIGIIFLLFALGLEFSFKKLARVGTAAGTTAVIEVSSMLFIGFSAGKALGWSFMDSVFLGGIVAISSTTIIFRAFEELGVKGRGFVTLVFGVLVVEDLAAVLLLVLLSTVAVTRQFEGLPMIFSMGKLVFFLTLWFLSGIFIIPTLLKNIKKLVNEETLLIVSIALCFLMVNLATNAGFSPALGAFMMGSILAETMEGQRIEMVVKPVKDLFAAIFFVSVGLLISPELLMQYAGPVAAIIAVTIFGKIFCVTTGALIARQSPRHALQAGFSLAQIGEFSFIIAVLGQSLKVTSDFLYPVAVGVSVVTTLLSPYLIRSSDKIYDFIERKMPPRWDKALQRYRTNIKASEISSKWSYVIRDYSVRVFLNTVIVVGIFLGLMTYVDPVVKEQIAGKEIADAAMIVVAFLCVAPFLWALSFSRPKRMLVENLWNERNQSRLLLLDSLRIVYGVALFTFMTSLFISASWALLVAVLLIVTIFFSGSRRLRLAYAWFESHFIKNLSEKEEKERAEKPHLAPWDAHITNFVVPAESGVIGRTLEELRIREKYGVTLALIERGRNRITAPERSTRIYPMDKLYLIGTDEQIDKFRNEFFELPSNNFQEDNRQYTLQQVFVPTSSPFCSKTIRECGLREKAGGLIVGIERNGYRTLNPDSAMTIQPNDVLWIVADEERVRELIKDQAIL